MRDFMKVAKALADAQRVRVALALRDGELCVCQIGMLLGLAPSTISNHLSILYNAGLIESRKTERWVYYRLAGREAPPAVRNALAWTEESLAKTPEAEDDRRQLKKILRMNPKTICQRYLRE
ncbi:MAG: metalloregulator ArsR/SmtB family transcription factor [Verrucomicrobiae bacterium]|nr:metalloregulator ArsR/SmtB family transcription factor [Verrucomicrobiae bacterium]